MERSEGADADAGAGADDWPARAATLSPLLTPALMVYYLCCWPPDDNSESSKDKTKTNRGSRPTPTATPSSTSRHSSVTRRRASDIFHRKVATSVVSLHLPSTSGHKKEPLSAHRSHEEIRRPPGRGSRGGPGGSAGGHEGDTSTSRYHSAPSVIDEVLHRRDWERSTRDLHIPLRSPGGTGSGNVSEQSERSEHSDQSPPSSSAPRAEPESSSIEVEEHQTDEQIVRTCKKHYTNIKSSKRKEKDLEDKDCDATEQQQLQQPSTFYIGDNDTNIANTTINNRVFQAKEAKQNFNESIRRSDRPPQRAFALVPLEEHLPSHLPHMFGFTLDDVIDRLDSLDRSGATHHTIESRISLSKPPHPPPSVEAVGWEGGACYLTARTEARVTAQDAGGGAGGAGRARHASDGDILAPTHAARPESGAFSESDLDLEVDVDLTEEVPPPYDELEHFASPKKKETAI